VLDVSAGGAALHLGGAALYLWDGQSVTIDRRPARVLRHFPGGVVVAFDELLDGDPPNSAPTRVSASRAERRAVTRATTRARAPA